MILKFHKLIEDIKNLNHPVDYSGVSNWEDTQSLIKILEKKLDSRVITFYISSYASLTSEEVKELYYHLRLIGKVDKLTLLLYGYGGSGIAAYRIAKLLRDFAKEVHILIPEVAASAMTMLAFAGDEIHLSPVSMLSPIDTSISNHPLAPKNEYHNKPVPVEITEIQKYLDMVRPEGASHNDDFSKTLYADLNKYVHPIFLGTIQRSVSLSRMLIKNILETHIKSPKLITKIVDHINDDFPTHSYPILSKDLQEIGIKVSEMEEEIEYACYGILRVYDYLKLGWSNVKNDIKDEGRRYTFIESEGFRSYYLWQEESNLSNDKWISLGSTGGYSRCSYLYNKDKKFYETTLLSNKEFNKLFDPEGAEEVSPDGK